MATGWVAVVAVELVVLSLIARMLPRLWFYLVMGQVAYWLISYVGRPALLIWVKPLPRRGDSLADSRLAADGYGESLEGSMRLVAGGLGIYILILLLVAIWMRRHESHRGPYSLRLGDNSMTAVFIPLWLVGLAVRTVSPSLAPSSAVLALGHALGSVAAVAIVMLLRLERRHQLVVALALVVGVELAWSIVVASKTPILAVLLALVLRLGATARPRQLVAAVLVAGVAAFGVFVSVQGIKEASQAPVDESTVESAYPETVRPLLDVAERFDLLSAATDAKFAGPATWTSPWQYWSGSVTTLLPEQLHVSDKKQIGKRWAEEVRTGSLTDANTDVYLATGFIAPGWVVDGWRGVAAEALGAVVVLIAIARLLTSRSPFLFALGASFVAQPAIFERSFVGVAEIASRGIQVAAVTFACALLMRSLSAAVQGRRPELPMQYLAESSSGSPATAPSGRLRTAHSSYRRESI